MIYGLYKSYWGVDVIKARKAGTTDEDMEKLINAIVHIWDHDYAAGRPVGSMLVRKVVVWKWEEGKEENSDIQRIASVKISKKDGVDIPSDYDDYLIDVSDEKAIVYL